MPLPEDPRELPKPRSPILSSDRNKKKAVTVTTSWEEASFRIESPELGAGKRPVRNIRTETSSPNLRPRRPPPPVPKPKSQGGGGVSGETKELSPNSDLMHFPDSEGESRIERKHSDLSTDSSKSPEPPQAFSSELETTYNFKSTSPVPSPTPSPAAMDEATGKSESMEELLKNLEEFNEVISSQDGVEALEAEEREKDFATIPRSELPVRKTPGIQVTNEDTKSKSASNTPEVLRRSKPDIAPKPNLQNGFSHSQPEETIRHDASPPKASPKAPPRKKRISQKLKDRAGMFESSESETQPPLPSKPGASVKPVRPAPSSPAPPKPERDEKKRLRSRLEVMAERQAPSSAPVSRTTSPDIGEREREREEWWGEEIKCVCNCQVLYCICVCIFLHLSLPNLSLPPSLPSSLPLFSFSHTPSLPPSIPPSIIPHISTDKLTQETSGSFERLSSRSPAPIKRSPLSSASLSCPPSSLSAAMKCISYLSEEERVSDAQLFKVTASSKKEVDGRLSSLDKGEVCVCIYTYVY